MARRLTSEEAVVLEDASPDILVSPEEMIRLLREKQNEALELTPESEVWFGDVALLRR